MPRLILETKPLQPILCSYPTCGEGRKGGQPARASWLIREAGADVEYRPICWRCKSNLKFKLGADERPPKE